MEEALAPKYDSIAELQRYRAGDESALSALVRRYQPRIERIVWLNMGKGLRAKMEVQDVVQSVFVRFLRSIKSAATIERRSDASLVHLVAQMALNELRTLARAASRNKRGGGPTQRTSLSYESASNWELAADVTNVDSAVARREMVDLVEDCMDDLAPQHRQVIELRNYVGYDWRTVAEQMQRSEEACQELHRRARQVLGELVVRRTRDKGV